MAEFSFLGVLKVITYISNPFIFLQVVTKTFHGAGIMVPVDKNDVGYRELPETDGKSENLTQPL